jgi:Zn ribbon nucleic-acid-binding protein
MKRDSVYTRRCVECGSVKEFVPRFVGRHATSGT